MDRYSLIKWNKDLKNAPAEENLLIIYKDDSGDYINYYTQVAWRINDIDRWVSGDNSICANNIRYWARFPQLENIQTLE